MPKFKHILVYIGFILTAFTAVAYLILLYIIIAGFKANIGSDKLLIFLGLGALDGILMSLSLRIQGIDLAKNEEESKKVLNEYYNLISVEENATFKKLWVFHLINLLTDIFIKGLTIVVTLYFSISVIIEGLGDFKYLWLGIVNVLLYTGLGFLGLAKAYDFYIEHEIPNIKNKIYKMKKEELDDRKTQESNSELDGARTITGTVERVSEHREESNGIGNCDSGSESSESELRD